MKRILFFGWLAVVLGAACIDWRVERQWYCFDGGGGCADADYVGLLRVLDGGGQTKPLGEYFEDIVVATVDPNGDPAPNVPLFVTSPSSGPRANVYYPYISTNQDGIGLIQYVQGTSAIGAFELTVAGSNVGSVQIPLVNEIGAASSVSPINGDSQSVAINATFEPLSVLVTDSQGNPLSGQQVTFTIEGSTWATFTGGGNSATATTGSNGIAVSPEFTASTTAGSFTVTVNVGSAYNYFYLTVTPGPATRMELYGGDGQEGIASTTLPSELQVRVFDGYDNVVSGKTVNFFNGATGAGCNFSNGTEDYDATSGSDGVARTQCTLRAGETGEFTVMVTSSGLPSLTFTVTSHLLTLTLLSGGGQSAQVFASFTNPLVAQLRDEEGTPVSGITVRFLAPDPSAGPSVSFLNSGWVEEYGYSDATGVATSSEMTANDKSGTYSIQISVPSIPSVPAITATLTNNP